MHYHPDDISRLFLGVPTLQLNRPAPAERFLAAAVATGAELRQVLRDYPQVRYQPLDFHYLCQQSLSALDDALLADLTRDMRHGWRGAHWAALLIALSGDARYLPHLDAARRHRGVEWTAGLLGRRCAIVGLPLLPVDRAVACATGRVAAGRRPVATVALAGSARSEDQRRARRLSKRRRRRGAADRPPLDSSARNRAMAR
ncbi:hypothetical protein UE94_034675 [Burkholderia cenocepacia]|uniref:hypothetical protein n=1 Tax=Burkholderia cenocepacia TaxID=95486 RepID=UPI0021187F08|nr:hypothetical protein [Burkholderia cenocepacia]MCW3693239.1 hypothetical protein [Burkholderia cenocepacia]